MPRWKTHTGHTCYFVTKTLIEWRNVLISDAACGCIIKALKYAAEHKHIRLHGYVIMPDHLHLILSASEGRILSNLMRDFGTHTSKNLSAILIGNGMHDDLDVFRTAAEKDRRGNDFKVWQEGFRPIALFSDNFFRQKLDYIHFNPVRKGLVEKPQDWLYSSARNYILEDHSIIGIDCI